MGNHGFMKEFYVIGKTRSFGIACLHFTPTTNGWKQRPIAPSTEIAMDCMKADYVCNESRDEIMNWIDCDFVTKRTYTTAPTIFDIDHSSFINS